MECEQHLGRRRPVPGGQGAHPRGGNRGAQASPTNGGGASRWRCGATSVPHQPFGGRVEPRGRAWNHPHGSGRVPPPLKRFSQDRKVESLKRAPLFADLSRKDLVELARLTDTVEVPSGKVLCKEGDPGREFFVLVEGEVKVARKGRQVATLGAGDFVGEISLVDPAPRTATVTARTPLRLFVLTPRDFHQMLDQNPKVERKIMRALARRVLELSRDPARLGPAWPHSQTDSM
jgi:CRP/FNR family cyclic AMP-dependent transcriptional regulator